MSKTSLYKPAFNYQFSVKNTWVTMVRFVDCISLVCIFAVFKLTEIVSARAGKEVLLYNNHLKHLDNPQVEIVYEKYESFVSMLHNSKAQQQLSKREAEGSGEGSNADVLNDHHTYYVSKFFSPGDSANQLWFELGDRIGSGALIDDLTENITEVLSDSHRAYQVWGLKFKFPYYGHLLDS